MNEEKFIKIYNKTLKDEKLNLIDKIIYSILDAYCRNYDVCFISNEKLAEYTNMCEKTIQRTIKKLEKMRYISKWKLRKGKKMYRAITTNKSVFEDSKELNRLKNEIHKKELFDYDWLNEQ